MNAAFEPRLDPPRERLYEIIRQNPGVNIDEIALKFGVTRTAVKHHVRYLTRAGLVGQKRRGRFLLHFATRLPRTTRDAIAVLRLGTVGAVVRELLGNPALSWQDLASRLNITVRSVRRDIRQLRDLNLAQLQPRQGAPGHIVLLHPDLRFVLLRMGQAPSAAPSMEATLPNGLWPIGVAAMKF